MKEIFTRYWYIGLAIALLLPSCALLPEDAQQRDSEELRRQLRESERSQAELKKRVDELNNRFEMLEARVKEIQSKIKVLEAKNLGPLEEGLTEPPLAADKRVREHDVMAPSSASPAPAPQGQTPSGRPAQKIEIAVLGAGEVKSLYDEAYRNYVSGNYIRARGLFQDFAQKYPRDPLAPNALYWLGECFYDQRNYQEAVTAFQKVVDLYPQSLKAPDALYKKGVCYLELKQEKRAEEEFRTVLNKYSKSDAAKMAQERLARMGRQ